MIEKRNIIVRNLNIRYLRSRDIGGKGVLLFLHGWGSCAEHFGSVLEKRGNFVAVDLPGFGGSEIPPVPWLLDDYVSFVKAFLGAVGVENPVIAGHSFGGSIGIRYCVQGNPCEKLILIGSAGIRKKSARKRTLFLAAKIFGSIFSVPGLRFLKDRLRKRFYTSVVGSDDYLTAGKMVDTYRNVIGEDLSEDMKRIVVPTTLIWGERDADTPLEDARIMERSVAGSELRVIPGAGHYVFLDDPVGFESVFLSVSR